jgi:hypothetical protein
MKHQSKEIKKMKDYTQAKKICKEHGVKGFKKMNLKRTVYVAGKQCQRINSSIATRLIERLVEEGFEIAGLSTCKELAEKGLRKLK